VELQWLPLDASASTPGSCPGWRTGSPAGLTAAQPSTNALLAELAQRVEACAPEPADTELPIPF